MLHSADAGQPSRAARGGRAARMGAATAGRTGEQRPPGSSPFEQQYSRGLFPQEKKKIHCSFKVL